MAEREFVVTYTDGEQKDVVLDDVQKARFDRAVKHPQSRVESIEEKEKS